MARAVRATPVRQAVRRLTAKFSGYVNFVGSSAEGLVKSFETELSTPMIPVSNKFRLAMTPVSGNPERCQEGGVSGSCHR
jgi:hypothetical protein